MTDFFFLDFLSGFAIGVLRTTEELTESTASRYHTRSASAALSAMVANGADTGSDNLTFRWSYSRPWSASHAVSAVSRRKCLVLEIGQRSKLLALRAFLEIAGLHPFDN